MSARFWLYPAVLSCLTPAAFGAGATLATFQLSKSQSVGHPNGCFPPPAVESFLASDPEIVAFVQINNLAAGDTVTVNWIDPGGRVVNPYGHDTITFPTANGYACLNYPLTESTSTRYQPAPGIWTVRVSYNGALLRTLAAPILPAVNSGGVLNAASFAASGPIAQGSLFSIFGVGLGPAEGISNTTFPLSDTLGDVSIIAKQGAITAKVLPIYVSTGQINALLPSNTPLGDVQLVVTSNGTAGPPMSVAVGESNFGAFSINGTGQGPGVIQNYISDTEQPINTSSSTARPGQLVILWGTGLGAITAEENIPPPAGDLPAVVQVLVGGKTAVKYYSGRSPCCAAVDEIVFEVPPDAPEGCAVPVQVMTNSSLSSNTVTIAIQANGQHCEN